MKTFSATMILAFTFCLQTFCIGNDDPTFHSVTIQNPNQGGLLRMHNGSSFDFFEIDTFSHVNFNIDNEFNIFNLGRFAKSNTMWLNSSGVGI